MELRDYQTDLISKTRLAFANSHKILSVLPCGAGKTFCFAKMCAMHLAKNPNGYVWFLVHRRELIDQTLETFKTLHIDCKRIMIAMVQTVSKHMDLCNKPSLIIFDEAHHATSATWARIIRQYPDVAIVGLTATPCRLDGNSLGDVFDKMIVGVNADYLIENKYLSDYDYFAPRVELENANYQVKGSDYDLQDVDSKLSKSSIFGDVFKYLNPDKKTIIYCPTIAFSKKLEDEINIRLPLANARHFDGETTSMTRKNIVSDFKSGRIRVLLNVDLVGEGFDVPDCDCCMLLRPTLSVALYIQQSMRCLRYRPDKRATIYDFVGNVFRHGMPTDEREWSLIKRVKVRNKTDNIELLVRECKNCFRVYRGNSNICPYCGCDNGKTKAQLKQDETIELEEIKNIEKKKQRREVGMCQTFNSLVELGKKRNYKNPVFWANKILEGRKKI